MDSVQSMRFGDLGRYACTAQPCLEHPNVTVNRDGVWVDDGSGKVRAEHETCFRARNEK